MSLTKFRLKTSDTFFYYDSHSNSMYNHDLNLLSLPPSRDEGWFIEEAKFHGVTYKSNNPTHIRILLGQACNYSCGYCMQKDIGNLHEKPESFHLDFFMKNVKDNLDITKLERVELWGGEPFLYWNDIKPLMTYFDKEGLEFFISTNGSPLIQKHIDFFKNLKAKIQLAISHDGPGQEQLRGEDILKRPNKVEIIRQIYNLYPKISFSFNIVISKNNYDLFEINRYFKNFSEQNDLPNIRLMFIPIRNYDDTNSKNSAIHMIAGDDLIKFSKIIKSYIEGYISEVKSGHLTTFLRSGMMEGTGGVFYFAQNLKHQVPITTTSRCGADSANVLSVDIQGNAKLCPHTHEKFNSGHINNIKGIKIKSLDLDRKNTHCFSCPVKRICKSSCPIKFPDEVFLMNCAVEKVWYGNIQKGAFGLLFNDEIEFVESGLEIDNLKEKYILD